MSAPVLTQDHAEDTARRLRNVMIVLALGVVALGLLFHAETVAAVRNWINSTAYNHCFLVVPIALYLAWDRRATLHGAVIQPMPLAALAGIPLAIVWLFADRLGIMEGRQLVAMTFVELLAFAVLGWRLYWLLAGPLLYLYFLVPFGEFLTPQLQDFTTDFLRHGLDLLQIPAYIDGYTIEIPEGTFYVAEACAGLRFLIASIAFGVLYALLMYRKPLRRTLFIVASIIVPVIANGIRALGIVVLGHLLGSAQAAATDHVLYGWIFFSLVILLLIALGLPFREDEVRPTASPSPAPLLAPEWRLVALATFLVVICAAISPAIAMRLDAAASQPLAALPAFEFADCRDLPPPPVEPGTPGRLTMRRIACDGLTMDVAVEVFSRHSTASPILTEARRLGAIPPTDETEYASLSDADGRTTWRVTRMPEVGPETAVAIWINGKPGAIGLATRLHMAWSSVVGASVAPVVIAVTPDAKAVVQPRMRDAVNAQLRTLLAGFDLTRQVRRAAAGR